MSKPTLFFSHSSKDKDMVLAIKNKVMQYTSGTLEIFQSSDGESIPFGTNWIHKVEEGFFVEGCVSRKKNVVPVIMPTFE